MKYDGTLEVRNFRSIKNLAIDKINQFNLLIGENNCGKSTILEALYMVCGVPQLPLFAMNSGRGANTAQNEDLLSLFYDFEIGQSVSVKYLDKEYFRKVSVSAVKFERMPQVIMNGMPIEVSNIGRYEITVNASKLGKAYTIDYDQKNVTPERIFLPEESVNSISNDKSARSVQFITAQWINYNVVEYVNNLVVNKQKDSLIDNLKKIDGRIKDIQIGNNNNIYVDIGLPKLMPIAFVGLGVRKFICIASIVSSMKDGVLLIDEFENGLHYKTMNVLLKAVVSLCQERNIQLFVTTHSYECIDSFTKIASPERSSVFRIERNSSGHKCTYISNEAAQNAILERWEIR